MNKVQIITPWANSWIPAYRKVFDNWDVEITPHPKPEHNPDAMMFMWADPPSCEYVNKAFKRDTKYIMFMRRYEFFMSNWRKLNFEKIDHFICVNDYFADEVRRVANDRCPVSVIYNAVDLDKWPHKVREHGNKVAMVCYIHMKKNIPMALQIIAKLPEGYELHLAGANQSPETMHYMDWIGQKVRRKVYCYDQIEHDSMPLWFNDKNYLLSTSISEGNPNNVNEALALGVKAVIHNWPGSDEQYAGLTFNTVDEAVEIMLPESPYDSFKYRDLVKCRFGMKNYENVKKIVEEVCAQSLLA